MKAISFNDYKWHVIVNPNALSARCKIYSKTVAQKLEELKIPHTKHIADKCNAGIEIVKNLCQQGEKYFIAVGGDGTVNEVVNGVFQSGVSTEEVYIAVIPLGTGNDWTHTHQYPSTYVKTMDSLNQAFFIKHDVGLVQTVINQQVASQRYFINIAGFGFDASIASGVNETKSKVFSKTVYLLTLLRVLFTHKAQKIKIETEKTSFSENIFTFAVGICQYNGNGMRQLPMANPVDGILDTAIIKEVSPFKVIRNVKRLYSGSHIKALKDKIIVLNSNTVEITAEPYVLGEVEGELLQKGDYRISILPRSVNMMSFNKDYNNDEKI